MEPKDREGKDPKSEEEINASMRRLIKDDSSIERMEQQVEGFERGAVNEHYASLQPNDSKKELKKAVKAGYSRKAKKRF